MIRDCNQSQYMYYRKRQPLADITNQMNNSYSQQQVLPNPYYYTPSYQQVPMYLGDGYQTQTYHPVQNKVLQNQTQDFSYMSSQSHPYMKQQYQQQAPCFQQKNLKTDRTKYKTEMCKNWIEVGSCRYGNKCQFAHGDFELNDKVLPANAKYKSKMCNTFFETLYCPYGSRCLFKHDDRVFEDVTRYNYVTKMTFFPMAYQEYLTSAKDSIETCQSFGRASKSRLPIFQDICKLYDPQECMDETPSKVECKTAFSSPQLSQQTSFYKLQMFTPDHYDEPYTDDEDTTHQSLYSDLNQYFSQEYSLGGQTLARSDTFSSILDGDGSESDLVHDLQVDRRLYKDRVNTQFFISRNDIPLFNC